MTKSTINPDASCADPILQYFHRPVKMLLLLVSMAFAQSAAAQVTANFTADDTAGCAPMVVHFTNSSSGATSYSWDLGNGTTTALTDVSGSYLTAGVYTITLVAHNGSASSTKTMNIHVYALPTVRFSAGDTAICPGGSVSFTSTTVSGSWGGLSYTWNFGDGYTSTATSPSHTYLYSGNYNATLFATNGKGCVNSLSKDPYITVYTPAIIGFSAASVTYCKPPASVAFSNSTIGVSPFTWLWNFGDGRTSGLAAPTHSYAASGTYDVSLKVTDGHGCPDSALFPAYITVGNTATSFTYPATGCINIPDTFTNTSTAHISSQWDFGDGGTSIDEAPVHTYTASGTYPVRLIIYTGVCYDTAIHSITISHPTATVSYSPHGACPHSVVTFNATVPSGCTVAWTSLNHGAIGTGTSLSYLYPYRIDSAGEIDSITMIVTNSAGCKDTVGTIDTLNAAQIEQWPAEEGCSPVRDSLNAIVLSLVYDPFAGPPWWVFGYNPISWFNPIAFTFPYPTASYVWDFGDGSPTSTLAHPVHTYSVVGGVYTLSCSIVTANGCAAHLSVPASVKVGTPPPMPTFTNTPSHVCAGQPTYFVSSTSGVFNNYAWDFGDGNSDTGANPVHVYTVPGIYTSELILKYNGCGGPRYRLADTVYAPSAVINYSFACANRSEILFNDLSIADDTHLWQFGDGTTSTASGIAHIYPSRGNYVATLTTYNAGTGCRDTTHSIIKLGGLSVALTPAYSPICKGLYDTVSVFVADTVGIDTTWVTKYKWYNNAVFSDSLVTTFGVDTMAYNFTTSGANVVSLVTTDNHGCLDTFSANIVVAKPVDSFAYTPPIGCSPLAVTFTDRSRDVSGVTLTQFRWFYGDGTSAFIGTPSVVHTYTASGTYSMEEIVTDNIGCSDTLLSRAHIIVHKPTASFNATSTAICARKSVHFTNTSVGIAGSVWIFGDGDSSAVASPNHVYTASGTYTVKLVVIDTFGCTDTMTRSNYITVHPSPVSSFYMNDSFAVCSPFNVVFNNTATGATSYYWIFGDGTSSLTASPSDVYIRPGYYTVKLLSTNTYSCTDTAIGHVNLFGYSGAFTYSPVTGCAPMSVHFAASVSSVSSLTWDFSDGVTSTPSLIDTISHIYTTNGAYVPKLILTDSFGCTNFSVGADTIKVGALATGFSITPNPVCQGNVITFHDTSSSTLSAISGWMWSFAPGVTSTLRAPTHTYSVSGTYPVTLTVADSRGCSGSVTENVIVNSLPPGITGNASACIGVADTLTDSVRGGIWTSSNTAIATIGSLNGVLSPLSPGTSVITYSLGSGCTVLLTITVNHSPPSLTGTASLCVDGTTTLIETATGGAWSSGATGIATVSATGVVSGASAGTAPISYTVAGCPAIRVVTVNPLPPPINAPASVCVHTTATLTDSLTGGTWTSATTGIATITAGGVVAGVSPGVATINYTMPGGCVLSTSLLINPPPVTISGSDFVCIGSSVLYTDSISGGLWSSSDLPVATVGSLSGIVSGVATGIAVISYNDGGCIALKTVSVNTFSGPITGPNSVCVGSSITLTSIGSGTWSSANVAFATAGSATGIITGTGAGRTTITYSLGGGCSASAIIVIYPSPAGITGPHNICIGTTALLNSSTSGGAWSSLDTSIAKVNTSGVVSAQAGGSTIINYTLSTGCSVRDTVHIIVIPPFTGPSSLCAWGDTATIYNADVTGTYTSTLATITNIGGGAGLLTTYGPGVATIIYTDAAGCQLTDLLTVNPLPGDIRGRNRYCLGSPVTFADTSVGGVWSASSSVLSIGSSTGIVTGITAGAAYITYTLPTGCIVDTLVRIDTPLFAGIITGAAQICIGATTTLADTTAGSGGVWSTAHTGIISAGTATGIVTGLSVGIDTVRYSVSNTCGAQAAKRVVTVNAIPSAGNITGADSACAGSNITLSDTAIGGIWGSSNATCTISPSGVVAALMQGTDTISYVVTVRGCTSVATRQLVINPLAIAGNITGRSVMCVGDTVILSDTTSGGAWSVTNVAAIVAGGVVLGVNAGTDTVYYSVANVCGTIAAAHTVVVNAPPVAVTLSGANKVCVGDTIILTDTEPGGLWHSTNANATVGSASGIVTGTSPGRDTVIYALYNNCGSDSAALPITVNSLPDAGSIVGANTICVGDTVSLTDTVAGGTWSVSNATLSVSGNGVVAGQAAGTDTVKYSVSNNCGTVAATQSVTVDTLPKANTITMNGSTLAVPGGYAGYQWSLNGVALPGATNNTYVFATAGNYAVTVTNASGCSVTYPVIYATDCGTSDIQVFPNPVSSILYIRWCQPVTAKLSVADGKEVMVMSNATEMDISLLPNGIYSLTLFDASGHKLLTKRITKLSGN